MSKGDYQNEVKAVVTWNKNNPVLNRGRFPNGFCRYVQVHILFNKLVCICIINHANLSNLHTDSQSGILKSPTLFLNHFRAREIDPEVSFGTLSLRTEEVENVICCAICSAVCLCGV